MIISASYRTDIPAFYGAWFLHRLRAGYCLVVNPYSGQPYRVSLARSDVDGFVFWTKNLGPFLPTLEEVRERGYPFAVQYSITGYPRALEYSVVDAGRSMEHVRRLAGEYGPRVAVWRYDPLLFSSLTPLDYHRRNFAELARRLAGATDEVVVSFAQIYQKTRRNLNRAAHRFGFTWWDPPDEVKRNLAAELAQIAAAHGMQLSLCSQRQFLAPGIEDARCVDAHRLSDVAGRRIAAPHRGHRPECGCYASRDIGDYDTCPHGCVYCYAVLHRQRARERYRRHDPQGEFLCEGRTTVDEAGLLQLDVRRVAARRHAAGDPEA
ncbi:MAG: DUF1848 domain-containing protein [Armatimonadetes bacterium]|nr:DUF1848 domain-containing protein [Armatimonadota bacterium]